MVTKPTYFSKFEEDIIVKEIQQELRQAGHYTPVASKKM